MQHSMIFIEEKHCVLAVGGEDENQGLLDSCESFSLADRQWKMLNSLNQRCKNVGLCKFVRDGRRNEDRPVFVYAFGKLAVERMEIGQASPKWEELIVKNFFPFNACSFAFKYDENLIVIAGGTDEKNSPQQDVVYFNPSLLRMERAPVQLSLSDKFTGGTMTQVVMNRLENKIFFCSEAFVHEVDYGPKAGDSLFKFRAILY